MLLSRFLPTLFHLGTPLASDGTSYANTPISLAFSIPVEENLQSAFVYGANGISLTAGIADVSQTFFPPEFSSDKKTLTLTPKGSVLKAFIIEQNSPYIDISVSFAQNVALGTGSLLFPLSKNSFSVRYIGETEETPPAEYAFFATIPVSVAVRDACENETLAPRFYAAKKSTIGFSNVELTNLPKINNLPNAVRYYNNTYSAPTRDFDTSYYEENVRKIKIYRYIEDDGSSSSNFAPDLIYGASYPPEYYDIRLEYAGADGTLTESRASFESGAWTIELDATSLAGLGVLFKISDDMGNYEERTVTFPSEIGVESITPAVTPAEIRFFAPDENASTDGLLIWEEEKETETGETVLVTKAKPFRGWGTIESDYDYRVLTKGASGLWGEIFDTVYSVPENAGNVEKVSVESVGVSMGERTDTTNITVTIADDSWEKFDTIYIYSSKIVNGGRLYFEKGETTLVFSYTTSLMYANSLMLTVYGIKDLTTSEGTEYTVPQLSGDEFDNIAPIISFKKTIPTTNITRSLCQTPTPVPTMRTSMSMMKFWTNTDSAKKTTFRWSFLFGF